MEYSEDEGHEDSLYDGGGDDAVREGGNAAQIELEPLDGGVAGVLSTPKIAEVLATPITPNDPGDI